MTDFKIIEIKPFYIVNEDNVSKKYSTLIDIANDYKTNISNIYHLTEGKRVKSLKISVTKQQNQYIYNFNDHDYSSNNIKEISDVTNYSTTKIHSIIKKFILNK